MIPTERSNEVPGVAREQMRQTAFSALLGAAMMLFVGFVFGLKGVGDSATYNTSVDAFTWTLKVGGIVMLVAAGLCWSGWRGSLWVDAVLAGTIGLVLLGIAMVWMGYGDYQGFLVLIFGAMFMHSALGSWRGHQSLAQRMGSIPTGGPRNAGVAGEPSEPSPSGDPQSTVRRLLDRQRGERTDVRSIYQESVVEADAASRASTTASETVVRPQASIEPETPAIPQDVELSGKDDDEPAPEGFLAQLGRTNDEKQG